METGLTVSSLYRSRAIRLSGTLSERRGFYAHHGRVSCRRPTRPRGPRFRHLSWPMADIGLVKIVREHPETKLLLAASGAFAFVLSALKIPSVTGSCSHATGTGLGAILFGPGVMTLLGTIVLLFQTLLLAHGGLTTLGANVFSMAVVGPYVAYGIFKSVRSVGGSLAVAVFLAAAFGDLSTYIVTSAQLAVAFPDPAGGLPARSPSSEVSLPSPRCRWRSSRGF